MAAKFWRASRQTPTGKQSRTCADKFRGGVGCREQLSTDGKLLSQKTGEPGRVRADGNKSQCFLVYAGQVAEAETKCRTTLNRYTLRLFHFTAVAGGKSGATNQSAGRFTQVARFAQFSGRRQCWWLHGAGYWNHF